jgi:predicted nucleotidyltransferase
MTMRTTKEELLKVQPISESVECIVQRFSGVNKGLSPVHSLIVIGSFTREDERTQYSDIDIGVLFDDQYMMTTKVDSIKEILQSIETAINTNQTRNQVRLWPKPMSIYAKIEQRDNYFTSLLDVQCNTPEDIFTLDGWSGLARNTLIQYEAASGVAIYGNDILKEIKLIDEIPHHEWYELFMISTRDLARGLGLRFKGYNVDSGIMAKEHSYDMSKVYEGENAVAKAILRAVYALAILQGTKPLNSYQEILEYARKLYAKDETLLEIVEDAYKLKTKGEGVGWLCAPKNILSLANPKLVAIAPIARIFDNRFYREVKQSLFEARTFLPFIELGNLEIYYERTIPRIIELLVTVDIDPLGCWLFWEEIRDFLISELPILHRYTYLTNLNITELKDLGTTTMENIYWLLASYGLIDSPIWRGSQYMSMQMDSSDESASEKINRAAQNMLYGSDELVLNSQSPSPILTSLIATIQILARVRPQYTKLLIAKLSKAREKYKHDELVARAFEDAKIWYEPKTWTEK